jgi:hypothetical protein
LPKNVSAISAFVHVKEAQTTLGKTFNQGPYERVPTAIQWQQGGMRANAPNWRYTKQFRWYQLRKAPCEYHIRLKGPDLLDCIRIPDFPKSVEGNGKTLSEGFKIAPVRVAAGAIARRIKDRDHIATLFKHSRQTEVAKLYGPNKNDAHHLFP